VQHGFHRSELAIGGYDAWLTILLDMGFLRLAPDRATAETHQCNLLGSLRVWDISILLDQRLTEPEAATPDLPFVCPVLLLKAARGKGRLVRTADIGGLLQARQFGTEH